MRKEQMELIADVLEAVEKAAFWLPVYQAIKRETGSKEDAIAAIKYLIKQEEENENEIPSSNRRYS